MAVEYGEPLSERELEVVALVAEGLTNRQVAEQLYVSPNTVKVHLRNIYTKAGVASRTELSMMAVKEGWVLVEEVAPETPPTLEEGRATDKPQGDSVTTDTDTSLPWPMHRTLALMLGALVGILILILPARFSRETVAINQNPFDYRPNGGPVTESLNETDEGWQELPPMPVRRAGLAVVLLDNQIYAIGGATEEGVTGQVDIYTLESERWKTSMPRPLKAANIGAAPLPDGTILTPGGCDSQQVFDAVHRYNPDHDTWEDVEPLPQPLCAYALTTYEGRVYLFGGWDGVNYNALTLIYDPDEDLWSEGASPAMPRAFGAAAAVGERVYYVGGYDGEDELTTCEIYDPQQDQWDTCARLLLPRGGLGLAARGWRLYAIGGGWVNYLGFNEYYDPEADSWFLVETPLVGEWRNLGVVATESTLYALGGWHGDYLNRTYALEAYLFHIFFPALP